MQTSFDLGDRVASNPRAVIGGNFPPPDEEESPPTVEEARTVFATVAYLQWKVPNLDDFMEKKRGKRKLGWRLAAANLCADRGVRQSATAQLLGYNRKTWGENQHRLNVWCEEDEELDQLMSTLRAAVVADGFVDVVALEARLLYWVKEDPARRKLEEQLRASVLAEQEALEKAAEWDAKKRERQRKASAKAVEKTLKGKADAEAIAAQHAGAGIVAKKLSEEGIAVLAALLSSPDGRRRQSELHAAGLDRAIKLGLARNAEPSKPKGASPDPDPRYGITAFGQKVALAAVELGRIKKKKRKKAEAEDDDELA